VRYRFECSHSIYSIDIHYVYPL
jgi:hypothetical protein